MKPVKKKEIIFVSIFAIIMAFSMVTATGAVVFGPIIMPPMGGKSSVSLIVHPVPTTPTTKTTVTTNLSKTGESCKPGEPCYQKNVVGIKYWGMSVPPPQVMGGSSIIFLPGMPNIPMP